MEVFVGDLGQFKNEAHQFICELQIKLASFWLVETRIPSEAFCRDLALQIKQLAHM